MEDNTTGQQIRRCIFTEKSILNQDIQSGQSQRHGTWTETNMNIYISVQMIEGREVEP